MEKKFRDLKKGDSVFIVNNGEVVEAKVKKTLESWYHRLYVYTTHTNWPYCGWLGSRRAGHLFVDEEAAYKQLRKISELRKKTLEKKINNLVSEFNSLDSIQAPTVFSTTKRISMKELKPGDSVWYVDKYEKEVKEVKVMKIQKNENIWSYGSMTIVTPSIIVNTFPDSMCSVSHDLYTGEEQAWRYMLKWKKSRMETVGKEMEKNMKELERLERYEI